MQRGGKGRGRGGRVWKRRGSGRKGALDRERGMKKKRVPTHGYGFVHLIHLLTKHRAGLELPS